MSIVKFMYLVSYIQGWVKKTDTFAANLNNKDVSFFFTHPVV
jgi:hypothetical protein